MSAAPQALAGLPDIPGVWRGAIHHRQPSLPTGHAAWNRLLPGGGWPLASLSEVLSAQPGLGIELMLPALRAQTQAGHTVALVAPPFVPYAPGLQGAGLALQQLLWLRCGQDQDALWAAEQLARSGVLSFIAVWSAQADETALRRLQLAAADMHGVLVLLRPARAETQASPAALRLVAQTRSGALELRLLKARGGRAGLSVGLRHAA
jgi:cell division inhibitor SulA/protein ImuA